LTQEEYNQRKGIFSGIWQGSRKQDENFTFTKHAKEHQELAAG